MSAPSGSLARIRTTLPNGQPIDPYGNPYAKVSGCPNCGKGAGWMHPIELAARCNSGQDPDRPCSRSCELQIEYAKTLPPRPVQ